ncbi:hypothetical protein [uncultured Micrococcus sp.]|uniref:hypothetical protein n=1 Tax=uncultured Micrococcus sp. TaxID=114051 RepID=UPI0025FC1202|nr:hypothetical protein [uncultured Micrococcus sp.]
MAATLSDRSDGADADAGPRSAADAPRRSWQLSRDRYVLTPPSVVWDVLTDLEGTTAHLPGVVPSSAAPPSADRTRSVPPPLVRPALGRV